MLSRLRGANEPMQSRNEDRVDNILIGSALLGFILWILGTTDNMKGFFSGELVFTYVLLIEGVFLFLCGIFGYIGATKRGCCLLQTLLIFSVTGIALEIGGIIALNVLKIKMGDVLESSWIEINQDSKNLLQKEFDCCGFNGPREFAYNNLAIDDSCYSKAAGDELDINSSIIEFPKLSSVGCKERMVDWMYENKVIWISCLGLLIMIQVFTVLIAVFVLNRAKKFGRSSSRDSLYTEGQTQITYSSR
ncbi:hypothetical protein GQR58_002894 [Nymphon striatum]|nr:hypothetical protein GQR58_002894 [Nymphon striatum]